MAKAPFIGVGGVARKVKQPYFGVGGVARKVKNGFIGIGGVARQFYSSSLAGQYLFNAGDVTALTGGWVKYKDSNSSNASSDIAIVTKSNVQQLHVYAEQVGTLKYYESMWAGTANTINLTGVNQIVFNHSSLKGSNKYFGVFSAKPTGSPNASNLATAMSASTNGTSSTSGGTVTVDVSGLDGLYYVGFGFSGSGNGTSEAYITSIQLLE